MRVPASIAVTVLAATVLAGCQFVTPQQTARSYTPSDGVTGSVGDIEIRNVFLIDGAEDTASVIGALSNTSSSPRSITLQWTSSAGTESKQLTIPANGLLSLSTDASTPDTVGASGATSVLLDGVQATPGGLFPVTFTAASKNEDLRLPVLTGSQSQYATLVPTPTPTPTRTRRATPEPTDSAATDPAATDPASPTPTPTDTLAG